MRLKKEERERGRGYQADVARQTGLSTAHIANVMNRPHQGVGIEAASALAKFWGMNLGQLSDVASDWAASMPAPASSRAKMPPNLRAALEFMRTRGAMPDDVIDRAARIADAGGDFSVQTWIVLLHDLIETHPERAPKSPAHRKRPAS
jgi:hypothetical protein